jgi:hypothetical protein
VEKLPKEHGIVVYDNTHFNFALRSFIYYSAENNAKEMATNVTYSTDNSCYLTKRTSAYGFTVKGGNNGESHNHIDVGSFILARNNKQIICDIGAGPYLPGYHTEQRYTFFNPSSYSHNIPIIDGEGEDSIKRDDVAVEYDSASERATLDIANAFGKDYVRSVKRSFAFKKDTVTLCDRFELDKKSHIKERFVTVIEPTVCGKIVKIEDVSLICEDGTVPEISVKEAQHHITNEPYPVYLIDYTLDDGKTEFNITFKCGD